MAEITASASRIIIIGFLFLRITESLPTNVDIPKSSINNNDCKDKITATMPKESTPKTSLKNGRKYTPTSIPPALLAKTNKILITFFLEFINLNQTWGRTSN